MSPPKIDTTVSIRDIISLIAIIITGFVAFQVVASRVDALEKSDIRQDKAIEAVSGSLSEALTKVTEMGVDIRYLRRAEEESRRAEGKR